MPRARDYVLTWKARGSAARMRVCFSSPDADEECVITGDSIRDARLDWLPDDVSAFFPVDPSVKKATLPCTHSFAAAPLAYHFLKNCMRCPVCRGGDDAPLDSRGIPRGPLRSALMARVRQTLAAEHAQQEAEDNAATQREISRMLLADLRQGHVAVMFDVAHVRLNVRLNDRHGYSLMLHRDAGALSYSALAADVRELEVRAV